MHGRKKTEEEEKSHGPPSCGAHVISRSAAEKKQNSSGTFKWPKSKIPSKSWNVLSTEAERLVLPSPGVRRSITSQLHRKQAASGPISEHLWKAITMMVAVERIDTTHTARGRKVVIVDWHGRKGISLCMRCYVKGHAMMLMVL